MFVCFFLSGAELKWKIFGLGNLLSFSYNLSYGWATINSNELENEDRNFLARPLDLYELSLVISIVNVGAVIGNFAVVPIIHMIGPKRTVHLLSIPLILSPLLIIWAQNVYYLYAARVLSGFVGGGLPVIIPSLINDICFDNVRGALNSLYDASMNSGLIVSFFIGNYMNYLDQPKIYIIVPVFFFIILFLLPESPEFWTRKGKRQHAKKSLEFYKGIIREYEDIETISKGEDDKIKETKSGDAELHSKLTMRDFFTPQAKKASFISFTSIILSFLCSIFVILSYVTDIFTKTGSFLSPKSSSLLVSLATLVGNLMFLIIVEKFNRRTLYIGSAISTALGFFLFSLYCLFWLQQPGYEWMPTVFFAYIIFSGSAGLMLIPYTITIEIFPKKIRAVCLAIALSLEWIVLFIIGALFPTLLQLFGLFACMTTLGFVCLLNVIFCIFYVPETRGKSYEEIMQLLNN